MEREPEFPPALSQVRLHIRPSVVNVSTDFLQQMRIQ